MSPDNHHSKKKKGKSNESPPEFRFINHEFTTDQKDDLVGYVESGEWTFDDVFRETESGYDFKLGRDRRGAGFRAHFICRVEGHADENACLSGRGATPVDAIYALLYRHIVLAPEGWSALDGFGSSPPRFG